MFYTTTMIVVFIVPLMVLHVFGSNVSSDARITQANDSCTGSLQAVVEQQAFVIQTLRDQLAACIPQNSLQNLQDQLTSQNNIINVLQDQMTSQSRMINNLQDQLTSQNNRTSALEDTVWHQTQPAAASDLQNRLMPDVATVTVAFSAIISADRDSYHWGVSLGQQQAVVFNQAITNIGNAYNNHTGIFRAPVGGAYVFHLTQMTPYSRGQLYLDIVRNGARLQQLFTVGNSTHDRGSTLVTTRLASGDEVWVRHLRGGGVRAYFYSGFSGFLLNTL